jgi:hypothetical protein
MAVDTFTEHTEADPGLDDPILEAQASTALERRLQDHPAVAAEIKDAVRVNLQELLGRTSQAEEAVQNAEQRDATLATRLDPAGHRVRRAWQDAVDALAAQQAAGKLRRHLGGLRQILLPWAPGPAAPEGTDRAKWAAALERAIRRLFPAS